MARFGSLHACLNFAYHPRAVVQLASVERGYKDKGGQLPGSGMTPMDRVAEAAMIQNKVERLPEAEQLTILARYGPAPDNVEAVRRLTGHIMPHLSGLTYRHMVHLLILQAFGVRVWVAKDAPVDQVLNAVTSGRARLKMHGKDVPDEAGEWRKIEMQSLAKRFKVDVRTVYNKKKTVQPIVDDIKDRADSVLWDALHQAGYVGESLEQIRTKGPIEEAILAALEENA